MTPQERQLVDDLFDRLAKLENAPRDPDAAAAIADGLRQAPNAVYALVQTVLLQDEALKRANARIQELEQAHAPAADAVRRLPRFDARYDLRTRRPARLGAERPAAFEPPGVEQRPGAAAGANPTITVPMIKVLRSGSLRAELLRSRLWRAATAVRRRRLVPRHRSGGRGRNGRRFAAAQWHPLHDGRLPPSLRQHGRW